MGIKLLNKFLNIHAPKGINSKHLSQFYGKKICVDTMIYIYKFLSEDGLLEKFYLFGIILKKYNIIPIFIFDGKPPKEKYDEIQKRNEKRNQALIEYEEKKNNLNLKNPDDRSRLYHLMSENSELNKQNEDLKKEIDKLKKEKKEVEEILEYREEFIKEHCA